MKHSRGLIALILSVCMLAALALPGCGSENSSGGDSNVTTLGSGSKVLRIVSGSENKELEPIMKEYAEKNHIRIELTYKGSVDIMNILGQEEVPYDAVWPASSLWLTTGDKNHIVKHAESISVTPVVFGIRQSLAEELGFTGREVSVNDILEATKSGKLNFCMTSATQSNSGACAYIGFLYALLGNPEVITKEDLQNENLKTEMKDLLSGVNRSSGSSEWLKDMFLSGDYDAMVNYESLIIQANKELEKENKETLYVVYPYDGLSIADSPLGYVDNGDEKEEQIFEDFQNYLLSDDVQNQIQRTGRRTGYTGVSEENRDIFREDWGVQADRVLSPIKMPETDVLMECLDMYQTEFKKPSLTVYCLDFSGSMRGSGRSDLVAAMRQILIQSEASKNYLQASENEVNIVIPFNHQVIDTYTAKGNGQELEDIYTDIESIAADGGTDMYTAMEKGLGMLPEYDLSQYSVAVIVMTDGMSDGSYSQFKTAYEESGLDIPIFSIMFGDAERDQLDDLATLSNGRVFDGRENLTDAFRQVRGYN